MGRPMVYHVVRRTPHSIRVCRLYRQILKEQQSWIAHRGQWNEIACSTRDAFKAQKHLSPIKAEPLIKDAQAQLDYWRHPNPYINPYAEGGVCYQRNAAPPYDLTMDEAFVEWK